MHKISIVLLILAVAHVSTQTCDNPLLTEYGFTPLASPTTVTGLRFCESLQSGTSCCDAATINGFQTKADALRDQILEKVKARDASLVKIRDEYLPKYKPVLDEFKANMDKALSILSNTPGTDAAVVLAKLNGLKNMIKGFLDNVLGLKNEMKTMQKSRSSCVVEMVKTQVSAWCLACDPNYATKGVAAGSGQVTISANLCGRLRRSCYDFVSASDNQNTMLTTKLIVEGFNAYTEALAKINGNQVVQGIIALAAIQITENAPTRSETPPKKLTNCNNANDCNFICTTLLSNKGKIDADNMAAGGDMPAISRLLEETEIVHKENDFQSRFLTGANEWNPSATESGVTITFSDDPAGVNSSGLRLVASKLALVCASILLLIFIF